MPLSNKKIKTMIGDTLSNYYSAYTGEEVDAAVKAASEIMPFIDTNISVPAASFTGDYSSYPITTLNRGSWLKSITLRCIRGFSASSVNIDYSIQLSDGTVLVNIPNEFMRDTNNILVYQIERQIQTGTSINMVCSSTRAFGEVSVNLDLS